MILNTREAQAVPIETRNPQSSAAGVGAMGLTSVTHALTALREEDPAFDKAVRIKHFERGKIVATSEELAQQDVRVDEWQGQYGMH